MSAWLKLTVRPINAQASERVRRLGIMIAVPKKIVPSAVRRNRIRRLIREAVRLKFERCPGRIGFYQIISSPPRHLDLHETERALRAVWPKGNLAG